MTGLVVDPHNFDKAQNMRDGIELCGVFLRTNNLKVPAFSLTNTKVNGYYQPPNKVFINLRRCPPAVKNPGYCWSYTGYKADRTPAGVVAHEVGHHVQAQLMRHFLTGKVNDCTNGEAPVTSYEPNAHELFAEACRLFILNPDLLRIGRPRRYTMLREYLAPVVSLTWREVLQHASPRLISAAESWIKRTT